MNWIELKALYHLYQNQEVKLNITLAKSGEINYLINSLKVLDKSHNKVFSLERFGKIYEDNYLKKYILYEKFLSENELLKPHTRFEESDIKILMDIKSLREDGSLDELREQIIASNESRRGVSLMFFKNEKYLDDRCSLADALKKILDVSEFANEKDQQYIYKLECHDPVAIVLCENLDYLTKPNKPRQNGIELWYAGGKNVSKLVYSQTRDLPIYYSCDWDYDGLFIIYPLVVDKIRQIKLLTPNGVPKGIDDTEHKSKWLNNGRNINSILNNEQKLILKDLIKNNQWIIEESNSLMGMLSSNYNK
jgi:hypothetical protein